ncbi:MAG TPA: alpha-1,4-glucan--maltose-1-phosphate maltosyltransferase [Oxalicibacterium sp.]|nr:alpha-1,4-glucan--maltose-1-phosphate maltosyltransferase [Oxalicibacterium sp.]
MESQAVPRLRPPRLYCIAAEDVVRTDDWRPLLARVAAMEFDAILLAGHALASFAGEHDSDSALTRFADACREAGLRVLLDLELDRFPVAHYCYTHHEENFFLPEHDTHALPDPRFSAAPHDDRHAQLRMDATGMQLATHYWQTQLAQWLAAGIGGFRCLGIARMAPSLWQTLIAHTRSTAADTTFLAWTPGCTPEQLTAIAGCGFDAVFSSDAWWDYRASWFAEENRRLSAIAPVIAVLEDPAGGRLIHRLHLDDAETARRACLRALQVAALAGDGILLTEGFAFGADAALEELHQDARWHEQPLFDLTQDIAAVNHRLHGHADNLRQPLQQLSAPHADIALLLRQVEPFASSSAELAIVNADAHQERHISAALLRERLSGWALPLQQMQHGATLAASEVQIHELQPAQPVVLPAGGKTATLRAALRAAKAPRIAIENIAPVVDHGRFVAKRIAGDPVTVEADIFGDGHDKLAAAVLWRPADNEAWQEVPMMQIGNDRWRAILPLQRIGRHLFAVIAWRDDFSTFRDELEKKLKAGLDVTLEIREGCQLIEKTASQQPATNVHASKYENKHADALKKLQKQLPVKKKSGNADETLALLLSAETAQLMQAADLRAFCTRSDEYRIDAERREAAFASWYELFPRSQSGDPLRHGTFDDVIRRLPAVRDMGFDTLYFPPIHPIGSKNKKGKNNSLTPAPDDPGSPYAIGSELGGHDAIHPQLGTLQDFRRLLVAAAEHGMEVALDFAIQCSPDHPWLKQHPGWFAWRPDGSIRYAENPPKKYEDIVNVDFYAENEDDPAIPDLWLALRDVVLLWVREGVRVFRVDNPHTKPLPFWEWMIDDVRARAPDVIFLSEAFTRPKPMYRLAKVGFSQSYTYFTWRHGKQEFIDYLNEMTMDEPRDFFRPHFFVNTPDINPTFLQRSGRPGFLIRAALATTLSGLWGMYSGFELCEAQAVTGKEEYLDSEKYEIRAWDWSRPGNIVREIAMLNRIRRANPALHTHLGVRFHYASDDAILYFAKFTRDPQDGNDERFGDNALLVAINLDPFNAHDAVIDVPLWRFGLPDDGAVHVEELTSDAHFVWHGRQQQIRLDPQQQPFAIWRLRPG